MYIPLRSCSRWAGQCFLRYPGNRSTVIPSMPGLPLFALTRFNASLRFSASKTSSINRSVDAGPSVTCSAIDGSVPSPAASEASPRSPAVKASSIWFFCRLPPLSRNAYRPLPFTPCGAPFGPSTCPVADTDLLCPLLTPAPRSKSLTAPLSPSSRTRRRPPEVSLTAFHAQPPDLRSAPLMDMDFAATGSLVQRSRLSIRFFFIGSRLCSTLPSDPASRRRPRASLTLHLHQVG